MWQWIVFAPIAVGWLFYFYLRWDEERDYRRVYEMFGTTGFADVDKRMQIIYGR